MSAFGGKADMTQFDLLAFRHLQAGE